MSTNAHAPPGARSDTEPRPGRWLGLVALTLGVAMIIVDSTVLNVAIPTIVADLHLRFTTAQWANTIYALVFAAMLIQFGRLADRVGRRRVFIVGLFVFLLGSVLAGSATSGAMLLGARTVQGFGGAMMLPTSLSILNATFVGRDRATAFAIWGATIGGVVALGPLLGGWAITSLSWRWAFYVNVPIAIIALVGVLRFVDESRDEEWVVGRDVAGSVLLAAGLALGVFAAIEGQAYGWWSAKAPLRVLGLTWPEGWGSPVPVFGACAVALLAAWVAIERARARDGKVVVVDFALLRISSFRNGNIAAMIVSLGELGIIFVLPLFLQGVLGYSALNTGTLLLALSGGAFFAAGVATPLVSRFGGRAVVVTGMALEAVGIAALGLVLATDVATWKLAAILFAYGIGVGFATAQLTNLILAEVPLRRSGQASGIQSTSRQIGSALGTAVIGTVLSVVFLNSTTDRLERTNLPAPAQQALTATVERSGGAALEGLHAGGATPDVASEMDAAFVDGARTAAFVASGFVLLGLLAALRLPRSGRAPGDPQRSGVSAA